MHQLSAVKHKILVDFDNTTEIFEQHILVEYAETQITYGQNTVAGYFSIFIVVKVKI